MTHLIRTAVAALALSTAPALSQDLSQVEFRVGYSAGGGYDALARFVAEHLGDYLPGAPEIIVQNEPGAGSLRLATVFAATAATDGSEVAFVSSSLPLYPIFRPEQQEFHPDMVRWVHAFEAVPSYCFVHQSTGIETFEEFIAADIRVGATGKGSSTYTFAASIARLFDANYEIITGFEGGAEILVAMERGDVQARCGIGLSNLTRSGYLDQVNIVAEIGIVDLDEVPGATFVLGEIEDPLDLEAATLVYSSTSIHRPMALHGDTSDEMLAVYRDAVDQMLADPDILAAAEAAGVDLLPVSGVEVERRVEQFLSSSPEAVERARQLVE